MNYIISKIYGLIFTSFYKFQSMLYINRYQSLFVIYLYLNIEFDMWKYIYIFSSSYLMSIITVSQVVKYNIEYKIEYINTNSILLGIFNITNNEMKCYIGNLIPSI